MFQKYSSCQWLPSVQCLQAKVLHQQGALWQWAEGPLLRGLNLCLEDISLSSSVFTTLAPGVKEQWRWSRSFLAHLAVFFYPFK